LCRPLGGSIRNSAMSDAETPAINAAPLFARRTAVRFCLALLIGFAAVLVFTWRDARREGELEHFDQITALGDTNYFVVPSPPPNPPEAIVQWEGRSWVPENFVKHDLRDTQMLRVGRDEPSGLTLYRPRENAKKDELYLKRDTDSFYLLRPTP
jgi:hypothetical protein